MIPSLQGNDGVSGRLGRAFGPRRGEGGSGVTDTGNRRIDLRPRVNVAAASSAGVAICPYCRETVAGGAEAKTCEGCRTTVHAECLAELGRCPTLGCTTAVNRRPCPFCRAPMAVTDERCDGCGRLSFRHIAELPTEPIRMGRHHWEQQPREDRDRVERQVSLLDQSIYLIVPMIVFSLRGVVDQSHGGPGVLLGLGLALLALWGFRLCLQNALQVLGFLSKPVTNAGSLPWRLGELVMLSGLPETDRTLITPEGEDTCWLQTGIYRSVRGPRSREWREVSSEEFLVPFRVQGVQIRTAPTEIYGAAVREDEFNLDSEPEKRRTVFLPMDRRVTVIGRLASHDEGFVLEPDGAAGLLLTLRSPWLEATKEGGKALLGLALTLAGLAGIYLAYLA